MACVPTPFILCRRWGSPSRKFDLGLLVEISLAVFENGKRDAERDQPTHNRVFTPQGGKTKYVGAFRKKTGKNGYDYLMGRIDLKVLGQVVKEGVTIDFGKKEL